MNMKTPFPRTVLRPGLLLLLLAMALPATLSHAAANPPQFMACQGYLTDGNGNPLGSTNTGPKNYNVVFRIWDLQTGGITNGSDELYAEQQTVTVNNGVFSVQLGQGSAYSIEPHTNQLSGLFAGASSTRYLEFTVLGIGASGVNITILPRLQLLTAPYAFLAATAVNAVSAGSLVNNNNTTQVVTVTNGSVGIGTTTPTQPLEVNGNAQVDGTLSAGNTSVGTLSAGNTTVGTLNSGNLSVGGTGFYTSAGVQVGGSRTVAGQGGFMVWNSANIFGGETDFRNACGSGGGGFVFQLYNITDALTATPMVISSSGYVGIGTTTPAQPLEVNGNAQVDGFLNAKDQININSAGNNPYLRLYDSNDSEDFRLGVASSTGAFSTSAAVGDAVIRNNNGKLLLESGVGAAAITINTANNVGIGTSTPSYPLDVNGVGRFGTVQVGWPISTGLYGDGGNVALRTYPNGSIYFQTANGDSTRMFISSAGYVGIGTTSPNCPLDVETPPISLGDRAQAGNNGYAQFYPPGSSYGGGINTPAISGAYWPVTIYTGSGWVAAGGFVAMSDARIKNIIGRSDSTADLATLRKIEISDFKYKDKIANSSRPQKKVIAQQVEKVYPQAVNQGVGVVPDIFRGAVITNGWVQLATDLRVGERVRVISPSLTRVCEVLETRPGAFRPDGNYTNEPVLVYGREVKDLRTVDYDAIAMLNVSATQELAKQVDQIKAQDLHVAELERKVADLQKQVAHEAVLDQEVSDLKKLVAQLARSGASSRQTAQADEPARKTLTTASLDR